MQIFYQGEQRMNFDFLKVLRGLGYVYENCNNA